MQTISSTALEALVTSHGIENSAVHVDPITTTATTLEVVDGTVTVDSTQTIRRSLSVTLAPEQDTWDALDTVGGEITLTQSIILADDARVPVPLGVFIVDQDEMSVGPDGNITLTCPDRWLKVQRNTLPPSGRSSVASNQAWQEIQRLVEGAWNVAYPFPGWSQLDTSATTKVGSIVWDDGNREAAIQQLCADNAVEVFFDATGKAVLRPIPTLTTTSTPVWTISVGVAGVLLSADRSRDRSSVHNAIIVSTSATDVTFTPVEVKNTTVGDPLSVNGPLGYVATEYSSPTLRNSTQARTAGLAMLSKTLGVARQLTLTSSANPALDAEDVIQTILPTVDVNASPEDELHIIDSLTIPLSAEGTQSVTTRSTRPSTDGT